MSKQIIKKFEEVVELLKRLNYCHDASMTSISFHKERSIEPETGDLVYPFGRIEDDILCDIQVELLHNNYEGARKDNIVMLHFKNVKDFKFVQDRSYDYSNLQGVYCEPGSPASERVLMFRFRSGHNRIVCLELTCSEIVFEEK